MLSAITKYHIFCILIMQKSVANMDNSAGHFSLLLLHYIKNNVLIGFTQLNEK